MAVLTVAITIQHLHIVHTLLPHQILLDICIRLFDVRYMRCWPNREIWRRHKRNVYVTLGVFGSGYIFYKLYEAHRRRLSDLERELASERENDELLKAQMQSHFESIQRIADTTLPHAMIYLSNRHWSTMAPPVCCHHKPYLEFNKIR
ncbi:hypothetical protein RJ639_021914 [Escallonia herrerae]|uniref:Uncharacterized protein n=1 Tax=Escallonia herrerae TaxID=1293975 RepID=A0AA89AH85_9ASTE|nr:hypothetical protein RJ639_021914 [Escallonia herrerae]